MKNINMSERPAGSNRDEIRGGDILHGNENILNIFLGIRETIEFNRLIQIHSEKKKFRKKATGTPRRN